MENISRINEFYLNIILYNLKLYYIVIIQLK